MTTTLAERYAEVLGELREDYLTGKACDKLSTPFLVNGPRAAVGPKVMVIGRECGSNWKVPYNGGGLSEYIPTALTHHQKKFDAWMKGRAGSGATFFDLMKAVATRLGSDQGLIYSNLFCFDYKGGDPRTAPGDHYKKVVEVYSGKLLKVQIEHFKPDLIIFANGIDSKTVRKKFFPHERDVVDGSPWSGLPEEIPNNQLWEFTLYGNYRCLRIQHPANFSKPARRAREYLVANLPRYLVPGQASI